MNIAMLTTWNSACGIAEYSRNLVEEFLNMGHNVVLFTNAPDFKISKNFIGFQTFGVHWWGQDYTFSEDTFIGGWEYAEKVFCNPIDVLHIQYQGSLYDESGFNRSIAFPKCKKVITCHDSSLNPKHKFPLEIKTIVHNKNILHEYYIPFPTIERIPVAFSFGMGRNDYTFIAKACAEIGIEFRSHDAREDGWLSEEELFNCMNDADAIVLWYNNVPIEGQSAALRTAISSMRPVIVNDVGWFKDAPGFVMKARNKLELQIMLSALLHLEYIKENSFENCAKKHLEIYSEI